VNKVSSAIHLRFDINGSSLPEKLKEYTPSILQQTQGQVFSGEVLMKYGMQLPVLFPQTALIYTVKAV
jgi:alpha-galactosidase